MRFSLQDAKKSIQRRGGELSVSPYFLQTGELQDGIAQLIAYHERLLGQPRRCFSLDEARACIGDYRLAHCLIATLSHWYIWRPREWSEAVDSLGGNAALLAIASPVPLRLALYDYVNEQAGGFLSSSRRSEALCTFAEQYALDVQGLEYLAVLDSEEEGLLTRSVAEPPEVRAVAALYNQWVFEATLFNASSVHFVIDCMAFTRSQTLSDPLNPAPVSSGAGAAIKRLCFLARKLGVYYDLAYDPANVPGGRHAPYEASASLLLHLTLYGPQEVSGAPQQYGLRLARLCRLLLLQYPEMDRKKRETSVHPPTPLETSHSTSSIPTRSSGNTPDYGAGDGQRRAGKGQRTALLQAVQSAQAQVHFLQRTYTFTMDARLLRLLPVASNDLLDNAGDSTDVSSLFDSSIEQAFSEAFSALSGSQGVDGWRLEREPEPLLLSSSIFIPDFALSRGPQRIYVEILGFWTPSYRERKVQKLRELQDRNDLLLAIPIEAREAFAAVSASFPTVYYDGQLAVADVLRVLRGSYDDFAQRLASIDVSAVRARVREEGMLVERLCYDMLHCYRRSELGVAAERIIDDEMAYSSGVGLYHRSWLRDFQDTFQRWLNAIRTAPLSEATVEIKARWPQLAQCDSSAIEALLTLNVQLRIHRDSIFDAVVEIVDDQETTEGSSVLEEQVLPIGPAKAAKKQIRERKPALKKRTETSETVQENLWG
jgi:predicted nuclease of restriction endonuclease-like RecB superfamily